jgi:hypothetical protein
VSEQKSGGLPVAVPILGGVAGIVIVAVFALLASGYPPVQSLASPVLCPAGQQFTNVSSECQAEDGGTTSCVNFFCTDVQGRNRFPFRLLGFCAAGFLLPLLGLSAVSGVLKQLRGGGTPASE